MSVETLSIVGVEEAFRYECDQIIRLFLEPGVFAFSEVPEGPEALLLETAQGPEGQTVTVSLVRGGAKVWEAAETQEFQDSPEGLREQKRTRLRLVWQALSRVTGHQPPWGILVGVRPAKVAHELLEKGLEADAVLEALQSRYLMRRDKASLILDIARQEACHIHPVRPETYSLYFGIPFCPTRCSYCSFPAYTGPARMKQVAPYLEALLAESERTAPALAGRKADSVYVGGGTPTVLTAAELDRLLGHIREHYDLKDCREITVEAGRPDTITEEKLRVMRTHGVNRICLNPQSFNQKTLDRIGRAHSIAQVHEAVAMIRAVGIPTLNMDLILGLPGEGEEEVSHTLEMAGALAPENLTVHTLALKKGSALREDPAEALPDLARMERLLVLSSESAKAMGMHPYYMYRQKFMLGNLENVGYSLPGHECVYNMQIMEERQDILSFGVGAVSKVCFHGDNRHERVPNVRSLEDYLARVEEMASRKLEMLASQKRMGKGWEQ